MDPDVKRLLEENLALAKDNRKMLRAMRREAWAGFIFKAIVWVVIVLVPLYFLQPYLNLLPSKTQLESVLKAYQNQVK